MENFHIVAALVQVMVMNIIMFTFQKYMFALQIIRTFGFTINRNMCTQPENTITCVTPQK